MVPSPAAAAAAPSPGIRTAAPLGVGDASPERGRGSRRSPQPDALRGNLSPLLGMVRPAARPGL